MTSHDKGRVLTGLARAAIARELGMDSAMPPLDAWLREPGAVFVTLTEHGALRGCIGSLEARRPLVEDLEANAVAAAFADPRFPPLSREELERVRVEVSILSAPEPLHFSSEANALDRLRPGIDGVILEHGWHRATFLPQVWEQLPEPRSFMAHLKSKAGLEPDFWEADVRLSRYTVEKFKEAS